MYFNLKFKKKNLTARINCDNLEEVKSLMVLKYHQINNLICCCVNSNI